MRHLPLAALVVLAACAAPQAPVVRAPTLPVPPTVKQGIGLARVLGHSPEQAIALLGSPTLDRQEGPARVLQFARTACVLDLFLYPDRRSGRVGVTEVDARTRAGAPFDPAACIEAQVAAKPLS
ncbi:MAG: hypothetical protein INF91_01905 [Alphaproteobacteria bacterium]|nr:hypothetical protein [Alphaproteobacteria bacterium]